MHVRRRGEQRGQLLGQRVARHPVRSHRLAQRRGAQRQQPAAERAERLGEVGGRVAQGGLRLVLQLKGGQEGGG
eukprot:scaffold7551_cov123-Isochrysis_galbana.AAC.18